MIAELSLRVVEVADACGLAPRPPGDDAPRRWFLAALARLLRGLGDPRLAALAGPSVPGATLPLGARVPGTSFELDPASAAASLGALLHDGAPGPVDAVAPALAAADYAARRAHYDGVAPPCVAELLAALALAEAVRGALAGDALCPDDPWFAPRVAAAAAAAQLLGADAAGRRAAALAAALDGSPPAPAALQAAHLAGRAHEHALRRAAGENAARALRHALVVGRGDVMARAVAAPRAVVVTGAPPAAGAVARAAAARADEGTGEGAGLGAGDAEAEGLAAAVSAIFPDRQARAILEMLDDAPRLAALGVDACVARLVRN